MNVQEEKNRLQKLIEQWLVQNNFTIQRHENADVLSEISVKYPNGMQVNFIQRRDQSDALQIATVVNIAPDAQAIISGWDSAQAKLTIDELKAELIRMSVQFIFEGQQNSIGRIILTRTVYGEGLTKQLFFDSSTRVMESAVMVFLKLENAVGRRVSQVEDTSGTKTTPYR